MSKLVNGVGEVISETKLTDALDKQGFQVSRLLSASKSSYREKHPTNVVLFNACIFDERLKQVWWGDIDITLDSTDLQTVANRYGNPFYVTSEAFRWAGLSEKDLDRHYHTIIKFEPNMRVVE